MMSTRFGETSKDHQRCERIMPQMLTFTMPQLLLLQSRWLKSVGRAGEPLQAICATNPVRLCSASCKVFTQVAFSAKVLCETAAHDRAGHGPGTAPPRSVRATVHLLRSVSGHQESRLAHALI